MALKRSEVIAAVDASLLASADVFGEPNAAERTAAIGRCVDAALGDFNRVLPLVLAASLTVVAGVADYPAPDRALGFVACDWASSNSTRDPWDRCYAQTVPLPTLLRTADGWAWHFSPAPSADTVARLGSAFAYTYRSAHRLTETESDATIREDQLPLLILRAQAEAAIAMALRNTTKPVQMRDGLYAQTRNGTPAAIADQLMRLFEQQARNATPLYGNQQGLAP